MFSHQLFDHMLVFVHVAGLPCTCTAVADLGILKEGFSRLVGTAHRRRRCVEPRSGDQSARSAEKFLRVLFSDQEALS